MAEAATNPQGESGPRTDWDIGKAMSAFLPGGGVATEEQEETQELDAEGAPDEDTAPEDEAQDDDASGEEDAEPEGDEETSDEFRWTLVVKGQEHAITDENEARSLAQKGLHYTQEMQSLRKREQEFEEKIRTESSTLQKHVDQYSTALRTLSDTYGFVLGKDAPDWAGAEMQKLKAEKPQEYVALRDQWDQLGAIRAELSRVEEQRRQESEKEFRAWAEQQRDALAEKVPEWSDQARREQDWKAIRDYAVQVGITEDELSQLFDHRHWLILRDAAAYRRAEAAGRKKVATQSKTVAPGSGKNVNQGNRGFQKRRDALRQTGDVRAAGDIFQELMTKRK